MWDQNYRHNLAIRAALENVYKTYEGDKTSSDWQAFTTYLKRVWFSNGIHHHYSNDKLKPAFSKDYLNINNKLDNYKYMTITCKCKPLMISKAPASVHVDKTVRPQIVSQKENRRLYKILSEFLGGNLIYTPNSGIAITRHSELANSMSNYVV